MPALVAVDSTDDDVALPERTGVVPLRSEAPNPGVGLQAMIIVFAM